MKLAAIYCVHDGEELLRGSIIQIRKHVDAVMVSVNTISYQGNRYRGAVDKAHQLAAEGLVDRIIISDARTTELQKRNTCLDHLRYNYPDTTHYIFIDTDEYYFADEFEAAKKQAENHKATVAHVHVYFKKPTYSVGIEMTKVPFICQLKSSSRVGSYEIGHYCDPTRKPNVTAISLDIVMHHYSWVRKDIKRKIDNSTAKANILRGNLYNDYCNAKPGMHVRGYGKIITLVPDYFDLLNETKSIQPIAKAAYDQGAGI